MLDHELQSRTQDHYESFPFDFMTKEDEERIRELQPAPFRKFIEEKIVPGTSVLEVGCGPGRGTLFMTRYGLQVTAVDLSPGTIEIAERRVPNARFVQASVMGLPFADESYPTVVSDGVIHHTPDARQAFRELARVLESDGLLYVAVYRRKRYYYFVYNWVGIPVRWLEKRTLGKWLIYGTLLPVYYFVHLIKSRGKRTWAGAKNFFYDYIITPQATFHTREEIEDWGSDEGLNLLSYHEKIGNVHAFVFAKRRRQP